MNMDSIIRALGPAIKGKNHNNRKNRHGRRYRMQTILTGPALDANQKTVMQIRHECSK